MNEKQPYEKHLADKLQQLPPPADAHQSWQQMRDLLDRELPAAGSNPGRPSGSISRWWTIGIAASVLLTATLITLTQFPGKKQPPTVTTTTTGTGSRERSAATPATPVHHDSFTNSGLQQAGNSIKQPDDKTATYPSTRPATTSNEVTTASPATQKAGKATDKPGNNNKAGTNTPGHQHTIEEATAHATTNSPATPANNNAAYTEAGFATSSKGTGTDKNSRRIKTGTGNRSLTTPRSAIATTNGRNNNRRGNTTLNDPFHSRNGLPGKEQPSTVTNRLTQNVAFSLPEPTLRPSRFRAGLQPVAQVPGPALALGDSVAKNYTAFTHVRARLFNEVEKTESIFAQATTQKQKKNAREKTFVAGISLPVSFPLMGQRNLGYNRRAKPNTLSDYLPSAHFQYHLDSRTYVQAEVQLACPQFIPTILLFQHRREIPSTNTLVFNSTYAKKLYYFNIPVSIHHSPFKNFYIGTGLQFSSLLSGIALEEKNTIGISAPQDVVTSAKYSAFKHDSLSAHFHKTDIRLLLDMNYYFSRFTVGIRFNQAFNNYIDFRVAGFGPQAYDKNRSLNFYLRYNIFEGHKREHDDSKGLLTFK